MDAGAVDVADRSHCSSLGTSCWLVDTVAVEPPLPEGREATGLKKFMESVLEYKILAIQDVAVVLGEERRRNFLYSSEGVKGGGEKDGGLRIRVTHTHQEIATLQLLINQHSCL
ncbi:hypothetical protein Bca4012_001879 [Brassica carinata]